MVEVSVVLPVFNAASTVGRAIESALVQTPADLEIIVVDDASTDDTARALGRISDRRVRVLRHERNRGAAAARNTGIGAARGALIALLDADDAWRPRKLAVQMAALSAAPDHEVSCTGVTLHFLDRQQPARQHRLEGADDWLRRLLLGCDLYPGSTLLARRTVFERIGGFDEGMRRLEDWDWLIRFAAARGQVLPVAEPLTEVFFTLGKHAASGERAAGALLAKHHALIAQFPADARRRLECDLWLQMSGASALEGRRIDALRLAARGLRQRPLYAGRRLLDYAALMLRTGMRRRPTT